MNQQWNAAPIVPVDPMYIEMEVIGNRTSVEQEPFSGVEAVEWNVCGAEAAKVFGEVEYDPDALYCLVLKRVDL